MSAPATSKAANKYKLWLAVLIIGTVPFHIGVFSKLFAAFFACGISGLHVNLENEKYEI